MGDTRSLISELETNPTASHRRDRTVVGSISTHSLAQDVSHDVGSVQLLDRLKINDDKDLELLPPKCLGLKEGRRVPLTDVIRVRVEREYDFIGLVNGMMAVAFIVLLIVGGGYVQEFLEKRLCEQVGFCVKSSSDDDGGKSGEATGTTTSAAQPSEVGTTTTATTVATTPAPVTEAQVVHFVPYTVVASILISMHLREAIQGLKFLWNLLMPACVAFYTCIVDFSGSATPEYSIVLGGCGKYDDMASKVCDQLLRRRNAVKGISSIVNYGKLQGVYSGAFESYDVSLTTETLTIVRTPLFCQARFKECCVVIIEDIGDIAVLTLAKYRTIGHLFLVAAIIVPVLMGILGAHHVSTYGIIVASVLSFLSLIIRAVGPREYSVAVSSRTNHNVNSILGGGVDNRPHFACETAELANDIAAIIRRAQFERKILMENPDVIEAGRRQSIPNFGSGMSDASGEEDSGNNNGGGGVQQIISHEAAVDSSRGENSSCSSHQT